MPSVQLPFNPEKAAACASRHDTPEERQRALALAVHAETEQVLYRGGMPLTMYRNWEAFFAQVPLLAPPESARIWEAALRAAVNEGAAVSSNGIEPQYPFVVYRIRRLGHVEGALRLMRRQRIWREINTVYVLEVEDPEEAARIERRLQAAWSFIDWGWKPSSYPRFFLVRDPAVVPAGEGAAFVEVPESLKTVSDSEDTVAPDSALHAAPPPRIEVAPAVGDESAAQRSL